MSKYISKTDFILYLDAPKHLWAYKHGKIEEKEINAYLEHLFEQGYEVEKLAEQYIKEILVPMYEVDEEKVLIQPKYTDGPFEAITDVLVWNKETNLWDMYEIKSSTKVDRMHRYDATFQYLVFGKKYNLGKINILHLNKEYRREGELDLRKLFEISDITEEVLKLKEEVHTLRHEALEAIELEEDGGIDRCLKPKECPCPSICHPNLPPYSIYDVNRLTMSKRKMKQLIEMEIFDVKDIPSSISLSAIQQLQVDVAKGGKEYIDEEKISEDLLGIQYPLYFLDYESFNAAIPMYDGYRPYDQMPFQWSLHIQREPGGELEHHEFIEMERIDPIPNFLFSLQSVVGDTGSIVVWNKTFEGTQNKRMGEIHPSFLDFCMDMNDRMYDLMDIFKNQWYAHPSSKGSYSIKQILPIFDSNFSYKDLDIGEGATAMAKWNDAVYGDGKGKEKIKNDLLKYCELDTLAMVKIFEGLLDIVNLG